MERMLFSPLQIRGITLRNRIVVSPMLTYSAERGHVNDWHLAHLAQFAAGGAGLVFMESTQSRSGGLLHAARHGTLEGRLRRTAEAHHGAHQAQRRRPRNSARTLRTQGAPIGAVGRTRADGAMPRRRPRGEWELVGPSAVAHDARYMVPREMTREDIRDSSRAWGAAARRANEAGFDVVEIHGAHGYLDHQFLRRLRTGAPTNTAARPKTACVSRWKSRGGSQALARNEAAVLPRFGGRRDRLDDRGQHRAREGCSRRTVWTSSIAARAAWRTACRRAKARRRYGYQVPYARAIRAGAGVMTMAVGMIVHSDHAEEDREGRQRRPRRARARDAAQPALADRCRAETRRRSAVQRDPARVRVFPREALEGQFRKTLYVSDRHARKQGQRMTYDYRRPIGNTRTCSIVTMTRIGSSR